MQRLARQFYASSRIFCRQNAVVNRHVSRRHYAVVPSLFQLPEGLAEGRYAQFYRLIRPDLSVYELARVAAALITNAKDDIQAQRVYLLLENNYPDLDQQKLLEQVNRFVQNPPPDNFDYLLSALPTEESGRPGESGQGSEKAFRIQTLEDCMDVLSSEASKRRILTLPKVYQRQWKTILASIPNSEDGSVNPVQMHYLADFFQGHGVNVVCPLTLPQDVSSQPRKSLEDLQEEVDSGALDPLELAARRALAETNPVNEVVDEVEKQFPNLMSPDPLMDSRNVVDFPPTKTNPYHNRVVVRNHYSMFHEALKLDGFDFDSPDWKPHTTDLVEEEVADAELADLDTKAFGRMLMFPLLQRSVIQQTGKGKIRHIQVFVVVGNGKGAVGMGMGTAAEFPEASSKARIAAMKNLDYVDRFEDRTVWTEMETKFGSTRIHLRPRPVGFGLRCGPVMHQILKAAGIKDISGKVWGSRNPIMIMHATLKMLQGGHNPLGMGDGIGGRGKRLFKGTGMKTAYDVERERGRKLMDFRTGS
ncbi:hypothetical protein D9758_003103 [Tetrapyrgos nigripes]|uniref:S5 DRBM domain-containing protein n=1 Tax=Tetrapyrgos nigripes TaxID=182062 RepID=A0A8H5GPF2_9AGAR|nr:hypothetical protein D9758_003103 [Tetrapyrgos nigripes]